MISVSPWGSFYLSNFKPLLLYRFMVELKVGLGRPFPGKISCHGIANQLIPVIRLPIQTDGSFDLVEELLCIIATEFETISLPGCGGVMNNRIVETSRGTDHRDRSVLETVDLIQAARFKLRRHEKEVGSCFDLVSQAVVEIDSDADFLRVFVCELFEEVMIFL